MARLNNEPRTQESPMDYQYDNGHGPTGNSPFVQGGNRSMQNGFGGHKRSSDDLDSPTKVTLPALRKPENQTFLFSPLSYGKGTKPNLGVPESFTTPRRVNTLLDDTTEAESSPAQLDSEGNTPDLTERKTGNRKTSHSSKPGKKAESRSSGSSIFNRFGKGDIFKPKSYTDAVNRRISKRRRREADRDVDGARRAAVESDSDTGAGHGSMTRKANFRQTSGSMPTNGPAPMGVVPSVLTFIDLHPNLPNTLSTYIQFILNCFFAFCFMYVLYGIFATIRSDIDERAMMESSDILAEMAVCAQEFKANRCERDTRVPAMENVCNGWEKCMSRDPYIVGRSRLSAGMFAEIFNSFIEPISIKAIVVSVSVLVGCFAVNNLTFGAYRNRHPIDRHSSQPHQSQQAQHQNMLASHAFMSSPQNSHAQLLPPPGQYQHYDPAAFQTPRRGFADARRDINDGDHDEDEHMAVRHRTSPSKRLEY